MANEDLILGKLTEIVNKLDEQNLLQKAFLKFNEACKYLDLSPSQLKKLADTKQIPHFCPLGKKIYFKRRDLDIWLHSNRRQKLFFAFKPFVISIFKWFFANLPGILKIVLSLSA